MRGKAGSKSGETASRAPGSLRVGLKEFTRKRIIDAALDCFREQGFRSTTVEQIADRAGTTVPTFYRHFSSKSDLFEPLREFIGGEAREALAKLDGLDVSDLRVVRNWLDTYMVMWTRVHKLCEAHWEATHLDETFAREVMPTAMDTAEVMQSVLSRVTAAERKSMSVQLALIVLCLDRMAALVAFEQRSSQANQILDEFSKFLWAILNRATVFADKPTL